MAQHWEEKRMLRKLTLALAGGALLAGLVGGANAQEVTLKMHHFVPPVAPPHAKFMKPWADKVMKESGGRIKIDIYPSMQLGGKPPQLLNQVRDGVADIVFTLPGYTPGIFPMAEVFELPFVHTNPIATNLAIQDYLKNHGEEFKDFKVLLVHVHAGAAFHSFEPIRKVEDISGMKIRTPSRTGGWLLEALGATPVGAPVPKVPELLSKKVVDGVMIPYEIALPLKTHEMVKYHTTLDDAKYPRPNTSLFFFAMNKAKYESMPADLKKVIDDNSGVHIAEMAGQVWIDVEKPGEKAAAATGELIHMAPAEVQKFRDLVEEKVINRWIEEVGKKGIDGAALLKEARALVEKYTK
jgi:TRAP-type C4-dicarboxylate transport system substrate-binding protein